MYFLTKIYACKLTLPASSLEQFLSKLLNKTSVVGEESGSKRACAKALSQKEAQGAQGSERAVWRAVRAGDWLGSRQGAGWAGLFKDFLHFESNLHLRKSLAGWEGFRDAATRDTRLQAVMACTRMGQRQGSELFWGS